MREPGSDGNLNVMFFFQKFSDNTVNSPIENLWYVMSIVHHFTWNLFENMTNRFPHIPDSAWISHALPHKEKSHEKNLFKIFSASLIPLDAAVIVTR